MQELISCLQKVGMVVSRWLLMKWRLCIHLIVAGKLLDCQHLLAFIYSAMVPTLSSGSNEYNTVTSNDSTMLTRLGTVYRLTWVDHDHNTDIVQAAANLKSTWMWLCYKTTEYDISMTWFELNMVITQIHNVRAHGLEGRNPGDTDLLHSNVILQM